MDLKKIKVEELCNRYNLPTSVVNLCVDDLGAVDEKALGVAVRATAAAAEGVNARNQAEIEELRAKLKELNAAARDPNANRPRIASEMTRVKDRLHFLGGRP